MSFGMWFLAIFLSPVYFMVRGRWGSAILNGIFWLLSWPLIFVFGIGLVSLVLCMVHALIDLSRSVREREMRRQAQLIREELAASQRT